MVHKLFAGYSYIMDLINIGKMEHNIIMLSKFEYWFLFVAKEF